MSKITVYHAPEGPTCLCVVCQRPIRFPDFVILRTTRRWGQGQMTERAHAECVPSEDQPIVARAVAQFVSPIKAE